MSYEIKSGPMPARKEHRKAPGPKPAYPFRDMEIGQWLFVPYAEQHRLGRAVKNAKYNLGIHLQVQLALDGAHWIVVRVPPHIPLP